MTWESGAPDHQRLRAGYAVLSVGLLILLMAWGMAVMRGPQGQGEVATRHQKIEPPQPDRLLPTVGLGMVACGVGLLLVLVLSVATFIRLSRRYREHLLYTPSKPTATADVWQMHKVPDDVDEDEPDDDDSANANPAP